MDKQDISARTTAALLELHMEVVRHYENDEMDAMYTVLEMAHTVVDLAMCIMSDRYTAGDLMQWEELVSTNN